MRAARRTAARCGCTSSSTPGWGGWARVAVEAAARRRRVSPAPIGTLALAGAMTHFATADDDPEFVAEQLARFAPFVAELRALAPGVVVHAANSAATLRAPASHFDMVRCGIAIYGCDPMNEDPSRHGLEPALELSSYVAAVKRAQTGESVGYGRRFVARARRPGSRRVPIGYGDGIRRGAHQQLRRDRGRRGGTRSSGP